MLWENSGEITPERMKFRSFQFIAQSCLTLWDPTDCSTLGFPVHHHAWSLLKLMSIQTVMPSNHLILCSPLLLPPSIFPSIRVFSNESVLYIRWPKYDLHYDGLVTSPCYPRDYQESSQHHTSKASIFRCSVFSIVQLSHSYMTTGKTIALTRWTFVGKVMSLLFNKLFKLLIIFLPRSKC